jgi:hypothetical protein
MSTKLSSLEETYCPSSMIRFILELRSVLDTCKLFYLPVARGFKTTRLLENPLSSVSLDLRSIDQQRRFHDDPASAEALHVSPGKRLLTVPLILQLSTKNSLRFRIFLRPDSAVTTSGGGV